MKRKSILLFIVSIVIIAIAFSFQQKLSQFRSLGLLGIFFINLFGSATIFLPAPAIATVFAGGLIYPPILVALFSAVGSAFGDMIGFLLGSSGKNIFFRKDHHIFYKAVSVVFKQHAGIVIFAFALIPNPFFDAIGILAGVLSYSPTRFFLLLVAGRMIRDILLAYAGAGFSSR